MRKSHFLSIFLIAFLFLSLFSVSIPKAKAQEDPYYFLDMAIDKEYAVKGETVSITTQTNYTGYLLQIYLPNMNLWHNQTYLANTTQPFLIPDSAPYGTYTVKSHVPNSTVTSWFTVLDISNWSSVEFPYNISHKGIDYTFFQNWTFQVKGFDGSFSIDLTMLRKLAEHFNLITVPRQNSMNFRVRFTNYAEVDVDLVFAFIHKGCKIIINGSIGQPRQFTFNVTKFEGTLRKILNGIKSGHLIFDWSDIPKGAFTYANQVLTVNIPENFRVDPYIFEDGFEDEFSAWTTVTGSPTIVESPVREGSYSMKVDAVEYVTKILGSQYAHLWGRVYVYFEDLPTVNAYNLVVITLGQDGDHWNYATVVSVRNVGGTDCYFCMGSEQGSQIVQEDIWYCVELYRSTVGSGTSKLYVDGDLEITASDTKYYDADRVDVAKGRSQGWVHYFDCAVVDDEYIGEISEGQTYELFPSIFLNFSLSSLPNCYRTHELSSSIDVTFDISSILTFAREFSFSSSIDLLFDLSSFANFFRVYSLSDSIDLTFQLSNLPSFFATYITQSSVNLVFDLSSTLQKITGYVYSIFPSIELTFDLSSFQTFWGEYIINPIINVNFGLSEFTEWISGTIHIFASIVIVFDLNNIVSGGIVKGYETSHAIALAIIGFVLAIVAICIAVTKKD